jgi:hypothetical protein
MNKIARYIFQIVLFLFLGPSFGQEISVKAKIDTNVILIGDQIKLNFSVTAPSNYQIAFPSFIDSLSNKIEIIGLTKIDSVFNNDKSKITLNQSIVITSFDTGYFKIPSFAFQYQKKNENMVNTIFSDSLFLKVNIVAVDTNLAIKDIKLPLDAPLTFKEILPYLFGSLGITAILIICLLLILRYRKKNGMDPQLPQKPKIPPYQKAIQDLEALRQKKLWQNDRIKDYHSELTEILRVYFEYQFKIPALEMTSDKILEAFEKLNHNKELKTKLNQILTLADLVKFAKQLPLPDQHDLSLQNAVLIVKKTYAERKIEETNTETAENINEN